MNRNHVRFLGRVVAIIAVSIAIICIKKGIHSINKRRNAMGTKLIDVKGKRVS